MLRNADLNTFLNINKSKSSPKNNKGKINAQLRI